MRAHCLMMNDIKVESQTQWNPWCFCFPGQWRCCPYWWRSGLPALAGPSR